ncbi:MAG: tetratricopeptide repeat protein [Candidatus Heimdallarchaeota archaeon]|nr:tetratricopeptide repeat protein [Candidatus Heimdallarchaeota archaeon]
MVEKKKNKIRSIIDKAKKLMLAEPQQSETLLKELLAQNVSMQEKLEIKIELAYLYWSMGKNKQSEKIYQEVLEEATNQDSLEFIADALEGLAGIDIDIGEIERGINRSHKAVQIFKEIANKKKEAKASNTLAILYYTQGDFSKALWWFKRTQRLAKETDSHKDLLHALSNTALVYGALGDIEKSEQYYQETVVLAEELNYNRMICISKNNLAQMQKALGEFSKAKRNYEEALKLAKKTDDQKNIALLSSSLGDFLVEVGELKQAYPLLRESLNIFDKLNIANSRIVLRNRLANYWMVKGQLNKAKEILDEALAIIKETGVVEPKMQTLLSLTKTQLGLRNIHKAYAFLKKAARLARERSSELDRASVLVIQAKVNVYLMQFDEAEMLLEEAQFLAQKLNHLDLQFQTDLLLARNFLTRYLKGVDDDHYYELALEKITRARNFAQTKKLIPKFVDTSIIIGVLYAFRNKTDKALKILEEAYQLAKEREMSILTRLAKEHISIIRGRELSKTSTQELQQLVLALAMQELKRATTSVVDISIQEEDLEKTFMVTYKVNDLTGPSLFVVENIDTNDLRLNAELTQFGTLYAVGLGAGHSYHEGLFGPIPFGGENQRALIYACQIEDPTQLDKRAKGESYILFTLIFPEKMVPFFFDRQKLNRVFSQKINELLDATQIQKDFLTDLRQQILSDFMKDLAWESSFEQQDHIEIDS